MMLGRVALVVLDRMGWLVPFAVETCGYMGKEAVLFVNRLGDIALRVGVLPRPTIWMVVPSWAMQHDAK